jgi:hypothetical protein
MLVIWILTLDTENVESRFFLDLELWLWRDLVVICLLKREKFRILVVKHLKLRFEVRMKIFHLLQKAGTIFVVAEMLTCNITLLQYYYMHGNVSPSLYLSRTDKGSVSVQQKGRSTTTGERVPKWKNGPKARAVLERPCEFISSNHTFSVWSVDIIAHRFQL